MKAKTLIIPDLKVYKGEQLEVILWKTIRCLKELIKAHNMLVRVLFDTAETEVDLFDASQYTETDLKRDLQRTQQSDVMSFLIQLRYLCVCVAPKVLSEGRPTYCGQCSRIVVEEEEA